MFVGWVEQPLVPSLHRGDVVVMVTLACHQRAGVRRPPHSPDLNPPRAFSRRKANRRVAAKRTVWEVEKLLGHLSDTVAPTECRNDLRGCGDRDATRT